MIQIDPLILAELVRRLGGMVKIPIADIEAADPRAKITMGTSIVQRAFYISLTEAPLDAIDTTHVLVEETLMLEGPR